MGNPQTNLHRLAGSQAGLSERLLQRLNSNTTRNLCSPVALEVPLWCQGFCLMPLSAATRLLLFNHPGILAQALDQMETIKLFEEKINRQIILYILGS